MADYNHFGSRRPRRIQYLREGIHFYRAGVLRDLRFWGVSLSRVPAFPQGRLTVWVVV